MKKNEFEKVLSRLVMISDETRFMDVVSKLIPKLIPKLENPENNVLNIFSHISLRLKSYPTSSFDSEFVQKRKKRKNVCVQ